MSLCNVLARCSKIDFDLLQPMYTLSLDGYVSIKGIAYIAINMSIRRMVLASLNLWEFTVNRRSIDKMLFWPVG